jgi:hypothetical protein
MIVRCRSLSLGHFERVFGNAIRGRRTQVDTNGHLLASFSLSFWLCVLGVQGVQE